MTNGARERLRRCAGFFRRGGLPRFGADRRGTVLVQFTVYMGAMFGLIGLSLDGARYLMVNNDLQDLADAAALRGAQDLDGSTRALNAIANAMAFTNNNVSLFNTSAAKILSVHVY